MAVASDRVFYFHADASAAGGQLTHPQQKVLETRGSTSLAQAGGMASSPVEAVTYDDLLQIKRAYTHVEGAAQGVSQGWSTLVTSVVEGVNLLNVVTADRIVARLSIEYPQQGYTPKVTIVGSQFENLRIGDRPVAVSVNNGLFPQLPKGTYPARPWLQDPDFLAAVRQQTEDIAKADRLPDSLRHRYTWEESPDKRTAKGSLLCSLVQTVAGDVPGSTFGHILSIPNFGTVFLGEIVVSTTGFDLTMLRAELGCSVEGTVSVAMARGPGSGEP